MTEWRRFEAGGALVDQLPAPVYFRYKEGMDLPAGLQIGFLAQELRAVFPDAVTEGWTPPEGEGEYLAINYTALICLLVNAVKELRASPS